MAKQLTRFDTTLQDIKTKLTFEEWATIPMIRIVTILMASKADIFNYRGIATMVGVSVGTAYSSIAKLIEHGYLIEEGGNFRLAIGVVQKTEQNVQKIEHEEEDVQRTEQECSEFRTEMFRKLNRNVQNSEPNIINNILNNKLKNEEAPPPPGLIKISEYVRLTEISRDQFKLQLLAEGFTFKERKEVVDKLDRWFHKNPEKYKEEDHFRDLMDWPLREIRKAKAELERVRGSPKNGHKAEPLHPSRFKPIGF